MSCSSPKKDFLPATADEVRDRGWSGLDVLLITGDAYVDHPAFGVALIGRWLEAHGYRVAVLAQPSHDGIADFASFPRPELFIGITAGNLDSVVANYSANSKVRDADPYSPNGSPYFGEVKSKSQRRRPDRATIRYANLARQAFPGVPLVLGGLEASLRRFVHYDYQQNGLRASVLADAKADILVYGMGERAVLEIARRLKDGRDLGGIAGTCERLIESQAADRTWPVTPGILPSFSDIQKDLPLFLDAELAIDQHCRAVDPQILMQKQQSVWVVQQPPAAPLSSEELDTLYGLPYCRAPHPSNPNVPAYEMIRHSVTMLRGCSGNCSFCAIARHQGPVVTQRSADSIVEEAQRITGMADFRGTISDLGGPTANLFGTSCAKTTCKRHDCLYPQLCPHLKVDQQLFLSVLERVSDLPGVKNVFVSSGLRMELLVRTPALLARLLAKHIPGSMKIAPEHTDPEILRLMHKPGSRILREFVGMCRSIAQKQGNPVHFTPYFISAHPGCTVSQMQRLRRDIREIGLTVRQFQDFTPTPGTLSTAMYVTGLDRDSRKQIHVARNASERMAQRKLLEGAVADRGKVKKRR